MWKYKMRNAECEMRIGHKLSLSLSLLLLIAGRTAYGQDTTCPNGLCPVQRTPSDSQPSLLAPYPSHAAHCRIMVGDGSAGSGTLVAQNSTTGLVLTCSHLFDDSTSGILVVFPSGARYGARLVDRDRAHDLAVLLIRRPDVEPVEVNDDTPSGPLAACGYGPDGRFRCVRGNVVGQATPVGATYPSAVVSGAVRPGDSGGGVLDVLGRLVGVVWGERNGQTYLTCGQPLREFLSRVLGRQPTASRRDRSEDASTPAWDHVASQLSTLQADVAALRDGKQDRGQYLTADALGDFARRDEVDGSLQSLAGRFASIQDRMAVVRRQIDAVAAGRVGLFEGLSLGKLVAGALGLSGPLAAAVVVAGGLAGRRAKARQPPAPPGDSIGRPSAGAGPTAEPWAANRSQPIAVDSPPLPQQVVPETHYVPYEKDTFAKAYQWASEQVVRKYPGTLDVLSSLDSLIKQQLNAQPTEERGRG
jgi:hypothetical protein